MTPVSTMPATGATILPAAPLGVPEGEDPGAVFDGEVLAAVPDPGTAGVVVGGPIAPGAVGAQSLPRYEVATSVGQMMGRQLLTRRLSAADGCHCGEGKNAQDHTSSEIARALCESCHGVTGALELWMKLRRA